MSGTRISGEVTIGNKNFFGIYSVVLQQNKIGKETVIASSSVVMKSTKDNSTYIGNPAKRLNY
jgi:acetyltransferase-like isoleucine patch superfamily enzyme